MTGSAHAASLLAAALLLVGCASPPAHPPLEASPRPAAAATVIGGELAYRQRIALPPDSIAVVELRDDAGNGPVLAEWRRTLGGQQVPIRFEMRIEPNQLKPGQRYALRGAIFAGGRPAWVSEAQPVTVGTGELQAGTLLLAPYQPLAFATVLQCGNRVASFGIGKRDGRDVPQLAVGDRRYDLREVTAASGARYEAIDDPRTTAWNKGDRFTLVVGGEAWPECQAQRAGGAPADLLVGGEWVVEDITGGMIDRSRATLAFGADGTLGGRASCNTFTTTYRLGGEGLAIGKTAATMMACAPGLMQQEARFLEILQQSTRFEISDSGALLLIAADGRRITARRPK